MDFNLIYCFMSIIDRISFSIRTVSVTLCLNILDSDHSINVIYLNNLFENVLIKLFLRL